MESKNFSEFTDEQLLIEKKKLGKSKLFYAVFIGFLVGVLIFGIVAWFISPEKKIGFFIPMLFTLLIIYKLLQGSKKNKALEEVLRERNI